MISKITIRNFKRIEFAEVELGERVVFIGPNNAGKTTCLQALALWHYGLVEWVAKKLGKNVRQRTGIALNRRELINIPISEAKFLWKNCHVKVSEFIEGKQTNENIKISIIVEGIANSTVWSIGLEFDYANSESLYCRPIAEIPLPANEILSDIVDTKIAFLQPMSGLSPIEPKLEMGRINVLLGEGQTAQILRNLCYFVYVQAPSNWEILKNRMAQLFGATLMDPSHNVARGEVNLSYKDAEGIELELTASGRGFQQTLLLLAYMYANPNSILLLDEPDAHLEILRQRQIYSILAEISTDQKSQIAIASHSEVLLNEAADRDIVIAFVGKPHRIDDRGRTQVLKSLKEIGFDQYYLAEQNGWVLYLEGSTDYTILQSLAKKLNHPVAKYLERPFVHYVSNAPNAARLHFYALQEGKKDLVGIALFDRINSDLKSDTLLLETSWRKREIENYFINKSVLLDYAVDGIADDLFGYHEKEKRLSIMENEIENIESAMKTLNRPSVWSDDIKITDDFLNTLFDNYFRKLNSPNLMRKTDYHILLKYYPINQLDPEINEKLDLILQVAEKARAYA